MKFSPGQVGRREWRTQAHLRKGGGQSAAMDGDTWAAAGLSRTPRIDWTAVFLELELV